MEFVRTCYKGEWQLFSNAPGQTTKGRYVRAPVGTPHYPGFHNFWSKDWVDNEYDPPDPPILGDVTQTRVYDRGVFSVPTYPAAVTLGSPTCIELGETYPPTGGRVLVDGFDYNCWASLPANDLFPLPYIWLRPESYDPTVYNAGPAFWFNSVLNNYNLLAQSGTFPFVTQNAINGQPATNVWLNGWLLFNTVVALGNSFTIYAVFTSSLAGNAGVPGFYGQVGDNTQLAVCNGSACEYRDNHQLFTASFIPVLNLVYVLQIARAPTSIKIKFNATTVINRAANSAGTCNWSLVKTAPPNNYASLLAEVMVFSGSLISGQAKNVLVYLGNRYGTPHYSPA